MEDIQLKIILLYGGKSPEHDVAILSAFQLFLRFILTIIKYNLSILIKPDNGLKAHC